MLVLYLGHAQIRRPPPQHHLGERLALALCQLVEPAPLLFGESRPYVSQEPPDLMVVLDETFGSMPDFEVPARSEWDRGYG